MSERETCSGCNHNISRHYKDVNGDVRCLIIEIHIPFGGMIGLLCNYICDCDNYTSESATRERERKAEEKRKFDEVVNKITNGIKEQLDKQDSVTQTRCTISGKPIDEHTREIDSATGMQKDYIVLCEDERQKGFVRPYRDSYKHLSCGMVTTMGRSLSETYARDPAFYDGTFCCGCKAHFPLDEFIWTADGQRVGS